MKKSNHLICILFLMIIGQGCVPGSGSVSIANPTKDSGKIPDAADPAVSSQAPTNHNIGTPAVTETPEKAPTQLATGEWHAIGSGMIQIIRNSVHNNPGASSTYKMIGEVYFDIWERKDAEDLIRVLGKGTITYHDSTTLKECGWEINTEGTTSIDGVFWKHPDCDMLVSITENWGNPNILSTTCEGINPVFGNTTYINEQIDMKFEPDYEIKGASTSYTSDDNWQEEFFILRDPQADLDTGCMVFEPENVP